MSVTGALLKKLNFFLLLHGESRFNRQTSLSPPWNYISTCVVWAWICSNFHHAPLNFIIKKTSNLKIVLKICKNKNKKKQFCSFFDKIKCELFCLIWNSRENYDEVRQKLLISFSFVFMLPRKPRKSKYMHK